MVHKKKKISARPSRKGKQCAAGRAVEPTRPFGRAKPVQLAERIAPSVQFQDCGKIHDPARSLLHGGPELPWKVAAGGYRRNRDEDLRTAEAMERKPFS